MSAIKAAGTFIANLMTKGSKGFSDGMDYMGDFDVDSFLNSNLSRAKNTSGTDLPKVTQGLAKLVGLGPKKMIGAKPAEPTSGKEILTEDWINGILKDSRK